MELLIKAENTKDLQNQIHTLASLFGPSSIAAQPGRGVSALPIVTKAAAAEGEPQASIFGGGDASAPVQAGRGRPKKTAPVAAAAEVEVDSEEDAESMLGDSPEITRDMIADELRTVISKCGGNAAREMMTKLGFAHLNKVPESDFPKFVATCREYVKTKSKK